jgi:hypothetical protein
MEELSEKFKLLSDKKGSSTSRSRVYEVERGRIGDGEEIMVAS